MVSSITNEEKNNSRTYLICGSTKERKRVTKALNIELMIMVDKQKPPRGNKSSSSEKMK